MRIPSFPHAVFAARILLAAGAMALAVYSGPAAAAPKTSVTIGMGIEPTGLDPTIAAPVAIGQVTWQNIFEGLVAIDRDGKVIPQLAKAWEVSDDGLTYVFELQRGVKFHDGTAFNAQSAKFSLDRARGADSVNPQKRFFAG